jgi:hypothetical protein
MDAKPNGERGTEPDYYFRDGLAGYCSVGIDTLCRSGKDVVVHTISSHTHVNPVSRLNASASILHPLPIAEIVAVRR